MRKIIKLIVILVSIGFIIFFIKVKLIQFLYSSPYFALREINISGERYVPKEKILILSQISYGDNIFKLDISKSSRNIESHPILKEALIIRRLPDIIDIKIKERNQVAYIMLGMTKYGLDEEGVILPLLQEDFQFPVVTGIHFAKATVGEKLDIAGVKSGLNVIKNIKDTKLDEYIEIAEINVIKPSLPVIYTAKQRTEIRLGNFPLHKQFESLKLILVDLRGKGSVAEYIDLRFGEKIVVKESKR